MSLPKNKDELRELAKILTPHQKGRMLVAALRGEMPEGFEWNYFRCDTCAIGLARELGLVSTAEWPAKELNVPGEIFSPASVAAADRLFSPAWRSSATGPAPRMVADALEKALDEAEGK